MISFFVGLINFLILILRIAAFGISAWATFYLITHGHKWVIFLWLLAVLPGLVTPFFTSIWAVYLACWVLMLILMILGGVANSIAERKDSTEFPFTGYWVEDE